MKLVGELVDWVVGGSDFGEGNGCCAIVKGTILGGIVLFRLEDKLL